MGMIYNDALGGFNKYQAALINCLFPGNIYDQPQEQSLGFRVIDSSWLGKYDSGLEK